MQTMITDSLQKVLKKYDPTFCTIRQAVHLESEDFMGKYTALHPCVADKIWMPDIFIDQAKNIRTPKYFTQAASVRLDS